MRHAVLHFKETLTQHLHTQRGLAFEALASLIFVTAVELAFACSVGGDHVIYFVKSTASFFLVVVLLFFWSIVRFERRQEPEESHER